MILQHRCKAVHLQTGDFTCLYEKISVHHANVYYFVRMLKGVLFWIYSDWKRQRQIDGDGISIYMDIPAGI